MGRISPGPTMWPPGAKRRLVPAKSNLKPQTFEIGTDFCKTALFFSASFIAMLMIIFVAVIYCIGGAVVKCVAKFMLLRRLCDVLRTVQGSQNHLGMLKHACSDLGIIRVTCGLTF